MIRAALLLSAVVCFLQPFRASATGQAAERLVVGRDTMQLFALPLATADSAVLARLEKRLDELDASGSTACWRRCIGVWRLDDEGILWLECVNTEDGDVVFSGAELVPEFAAGSRARAGWFSGEIRYGTGNLVYYQHDGFMRNLEREWVAAVSEGRVRETKAYRNRLYERGADATDNAQRVAAAFDSLHVGKSPDLLSLYVVFAAAVAGSSAGVSLGVALGCLVGRRGLEGTGVFYSAAQGRNGLETAKRITMLIAPACRGA